MKSTILTTSLLWFCFACNSSTDKPKQENEMEKKPTITEKPFGNYEGKPVTEYTLTNVNGMQVGIINYGGAVSKIVTPDRSGGMGDVVTGFDTLAGYVQRGVPYFGALVGRYGNRIAKGKFKIDTTVYTPSLRLPMNDQCSSCIAASSPINFFCDSKDRWPGQQNR